MNIGLEYLTLWSGHVLYWRQFCLHSIDILLLSFYVDKFLTLYVQIFFISIYEVARVVPHICIPKDILPLLTYTTSMCQRNSINRNKHTRRLIGTQNKCFRCWFAKFSRAYMEIVTMNYDLYIHLHTNCRLQHYNRQKTKLFNFELV